MKFLQTRELDEAGTSDQHFRMYYARTMGHYVKGAKALRSLAGLHKRSQRIDKMIDRIVNCYYRAMKQARQPAKKRHP